MSESSAPTNPRSPRWWNAPADAGETESASIAETMSVWLSMPNTDIITAPEYAIVPIVRSPPSASARRLRRSPANTTSTMQPIMKSQRARG